MGDMGAESSEWYARPEFEERLDMAILEEALLSLWGVVLWVRLGRRRWRDASAAGLLGTGLRLTGAMASGTGSVSKVETPGLRGPVFGGELRRPRIGDSPVILSSGSVTSATECRLVWLVRRPLARFELWLWYNAGAMIGV
jgi:hypothetical protein